MSDTPHPILRLIEEDRRYALDAYVFISEAMYYAQNTLGMGAECPTEPLADSLREAKALDGMEEFEERDEDAEEDASSSHRHVTGQEFCEAIRCYALDQYGYMAKTVLNNWGIRSTGDFGQIVYNLIRIGQMRKTPSDSVVDFNDVYDFETAFRRDFKIIPEPKDS